MPDLTPAHIALIAVLAVIGVILGWILHGNRSAREKAAVSAGWQEQIGAQRTEHNRLTEQNKGLMEQVNQLQASNRDAKNRSKELSEAIQIAYSRRDELQRELKDIRTHLETAMSERDQLRTSKEGRQDKNNDEAKDARIAQLETELQRWQDRLPPLIEGFHAKKEESEQLSTDLNAARARIRELEAMIEHGQTRVDPVEDPDTLTDGRGASNDPLETEVPPVEESIMPDEPDLGASDSMTVEAVNDQDHDTGMMNGSRDDLKKIKGVGPAIEKTLNELGITRFDQIADMSEYDIDRVANRLRGFRSRIYREDWIGQARELRDQQADG